MNSFGALLDIIMESVEFVDKKAMWSEEGVG